MNPTLTDYLSRFYAEHKAYDDLQSDRLQRWRNLEPDAAALLAVLARAQKPSRILEIGTSNGYSTCWLADVARELAAEFVSVDNDPSRIAAAESTLTGAGLREHVELRCVDAADVLADTPDQHYELVFLDAERPHYVSYWPQLRRILTPRGMLVTDNVLSHPDQVTDFLALVDTPDRASTTVPTGAGLFVSIGVG